MTDMRYHFQVAALVAFSLLAGRADAESAKVEVRDDRGSGVASTVYSPKVADENEVGPTDGNGDLLLSNGCGERRVLIAEPMSPFFHSGKALCLPEAGTIRILVSEMALVDNLRAKALELEESGELAKAAFVWNEVAGRLRVSEPAEAAAARLKTITLFGRYIGEDALTPTYFDPVQKRKVMAPDMADAVRRYQEQNGFRANGTLNYETLSGAAQAEINEYLFARVAVENAG